MNIDTYNLRNVILHEGDQFREGLDAAGDVTILGDFDSIMISGMGGSALPGNILRIFLNSLWHETGGSQKKIAVYQNRNYSLPPEAYQNCLNFICSHSGNTEETVAALEEVIEKELPAVGISSGGKVEDLCNTHGIPHVKLPIPFENFQPRMATGHFIAVFFRVLANSKLIVDKEKELLACGQDLQKAIPEMEETGKTLAKEIAGKTPIIYSTTQFKSLAMIWKIKINENAKTPAFWNFFPELNHNEMVGWTQPQGKFIVVILRDAHTNPRTLKRFEITAQLLEEKGVEVVTLDIVDGPLFNRIFHTLALGDWVSYYLALEYGIDPTPVDMVEDLKKMLTE